MKPLLEINSEMYTRRLAKQVNEAIGVRGAFHDGRLIYKAIAWCCVRSPTVHPDSSQRWEQRCASSSVR